MMGQLIDILKQVKRVMILYIGQSGANLRHRTGALVFLFFLNLLFIMEKVHSVKPIFSTIQHDGDLNFRAISFLSNITYIH